MSTRQELYLVYSSVFDSEYHYTPSKKGLDILVQNGYYRYTDPSEQFIHSREIEHAIHATHKRELEAKVFLLADSYQYVCSHEPREMIRDWSAWLGKAEYNLGRAVSTKNYTPYRMLKKAIEHVHCARRNGSTSYVDMNILSYCYYQLKEYQNALEYYLQTENHEENPHRARAIGSCYLSLGKPEKSIHYFLCSLEHAPDELFSGYVSYLVGRALVEQGDTKKGYEFFEQACSFGFSEKKVRFYLEKTIQNESA